MFVLMFDFYCYNGRNSFPYAIFHDRTEAENRKQEIEWYRNRLHSIHSEDEDESIVEKLFVDYINREGFYYDSILSMRVVEVPIYER